MGRMKEQALKELEQYMEDFAEITEGEMETLTSADLDEFWEDFSTESPEDSKEAKKEEVKKRDEYYTLGPKTVRIPKKDPYYG